MTTFLKRVALFLVLPVAWVTLTVWLTRASVEGVDAGGLYSCDYERLGSPQSRPRLVLMGSSTVLYGVNPTLLAERLGLGKGEVVMLADEAHTPLHNYFVYRSAGSIMADVRTIVYGIDTWLFSERYYQYDLYAFCLWSPRELAYSIWRRYVTLRRLSGVNYYAHLMTGRDAGLAPRREVAAGLKSVTLNKRPLNFDDPPQMWFERNVYDMAELQFRYFKRLKEDVEGRGIEFVVLLPPKSKRWRDAYRAGCADVDDEFVDLWTKYVGDSSVLGSYGTVGVDREGELFRDGVHLNGKGREYYTLEFAKEFAHRSKGRNARMKNTFLY